MSIFQSASDEAQQNLVLVKIDPHLGAKSDIPFRIEPDQVIVPGESCFVIMVRIALPEGSRKKVTQYSFCKINKEEYLSLFRFLQT